MLDCSRLQIREKSESLSGGEKYLKVVDMSYIVYVPMPLYHARLLKIAD
jgi:hypothetical protein